VRVKKKNEPEAKSYRRTAIISEIRAIATATLDKPTGSAEDEFQKSTFQRIYLGQSSRD
jgi:hypothetical protein